MLNLPTVYLSHYLIIHGPGSCLPAIEDSVKELFKIIKKYKYGCFKDKLMIITLYYPQPGADYPYINCPCTGCCPVISIRRQIKKWP